MSALSCESNQYYVRIVKTSGSRGNTETFTVSATVDGAEQVLITGVPVPPNTNATTEHCVPKMQSGEYTLTLGQAYDSSPFFTTRDNTAWSPSSSIMLMNEDNVVVFSGTKYSAKSVFPFKRSAYSAPSPVVSYIAPSGSSAYVLTQFEMREWWTREFTMDENWELTSTATPRTYEGNHIYRYAFDLPDLAKYSHLVLRVKYRYGVAMWINSQRLLRERLQEC